MALLGALLASALAFLATPARAGIAVVFREDFESGILGPRWNATDANPVAGLDYWGVSSYKVNSGNYSAYCAQVGTQAATGQNNSDVHLYDNSMDADLAVNFSVGGFSSLTLTFYYWVKTQFGGGDWLFAWYEAGGTNTTFLPPVASTSGNAWVLVSWALPSNVTRVVFRFHSDATGNNFEGAYLDDIVVTGTENNPPTSSALPLPTYENTAMIDVPFNARDGANESGVAYVELWYRHGTAGNFTLFTRPANPLGQWIASPARFDIAYAAGEGYYEFYTIAVDNASNREAAPAGPDASTTIDATAPTVSISAPASGAWSTTPSVTATWAGFDALSGLDRFETSVDGGGFASQSLSTTMPLTGLPDGMHTFRVRAYDRAGNMAAASVTFGVDATAPAIAVSAPSNGAWLADHDVTVSWTGSDATSGIDRYETSLDGGAFVPIADVAHVFTNLPDGAHAVTVRAVDVAGNSAVADVTFRVDTTPPTVNVTSPSGRGLVHTSSPTIEWNATDAGSGVDHFEVWLDDGPHATVTAMKQTFTGVSDGQHTFHIRAYDRVGNVRETSMTFTVNTNTFSGEGPYGPWPLLLLILAVALAIILFLIWRRRKEEDAPAPASPSEPTSPPEAPETPAEPQDPPADDPSPNPEPETINAIPASPPTAASDTASELRASAPAR